MRNRASHWSKVHKVSPSLPWPSGFRCPTMRGSCVLTLLPFRYVDYAMQRVRLLRHHKIQPYIVFDGGPLPAKAGTETERKQRREENLAKANTLASQGRHKEAREYFIKCIDVTPQMAYQFIKVCVKLLSLGNSSDTFSPLGLACRERLLRCRTVRG